MSPMHSKIPCILPSAIALMNQPIEINSQFKKAIEIMENTDKNVFITGKAGTGKSTLLGYFRSVTKKNIVVLATTGVAAVNIEGETAHSFFGFKPDITLDKVKKIGGKRASIYKKLDAIVIDEVSMMRSDLLDCVDKFLRLNGKDAYRPFGGAQMLFFGDLYQLPPVVTGMEREIFRTHYASPYFFDANVFQDCHLEFVELEKIYRQKDDGFIVLLNSIRNNSIAEEGLAALNARLGAPLERSGTAGFTITLTTTNLMAAILNEEHLGRLKTKIHTYDAEITGSFKEQSFPAEKNLNIAGGAQVMLLNNDPGDRWVNGTLGRVIDMEPGEEGEPDGILVELAGGKIAKILPYTWEIFHYRYDGSEKAIKTETVGSFTQYPIKLAWSVTIHKSQGKTFDRVIIDMGNGAFAHGQTYVALSRCTTLEGISLKKPIKKSHVLLDWRIVKFMTGHQYKVSEENMSLKKKLDLIRRAIKEKGRLDIVYLKASDEKSRRVVKPISVGDMVYLDKPFTGMKAWCEKRREERVFRVDRILEMKEAGG